MTRSQFFTTFAALFGGAWVVKGQHIAPQTDSTAAGNWAGPEERNKPRVYRNGECPVCALMAPPIPWQDVVFGKHLSVACK